MVFSSSIFLFLFFPVTLGFYFMIPRGWRNLWLLAASVFFYAYGERVFFLVMLASIVMNYAFGLGVEAVRGRPLAGRLALMGAVGANLALLGGFKYANFAADNLNRLLALFHAAPVHLAPVHLPIGISFITFHGISYIIDIHRRQARVQHNFWNVALYLALFPQLVAGPIIRFKDIAGQIVARAVTSERMAEGIRRFTLGLGKKVLIANPISAAADQLFNLPATGLTPGLAWLAAICYTLQIYFDFSGYSDMAIGLASMFGFRFPENFNYPYIARSLTDFWRRWHISLSTWFRDYLYIPLGGNRHGPARTYFNLLVVFFLCGLWHGASWNYVAWGLWHGAFLVLERLGRPGTGMEMGPGEWAPNRGAGLNFALGLTRHLYVLPVVVIGWVFFRAGSLTQALEMIKVMAGLAGTGEWAGYGSLFREPRLAATLTAGVVLAAPVWPWLAQWRRRKAPPATIETLAGLAELALIMIIFFAAARQLATSAANPFIYFRF